MTRTLLGIMLFRQTSPAYTNTLVLICLVHQRSKQMKTLDYLSRSWGWISLLTPTMERANPRISIFLKSDGHLYSWRKLQFIIRTASQKQSARKTWGPFRVGKLVLIAINNTARKLAWAEWRPHIAGITHFLIDRRSTNCLFGCIGKCHCPSLLTKGHHYRSRSLTVFASTLARYTGILCCGDSQYAGKEI